MSRKIHDGSDARSTRPPRMRASSDGERREAIAPHPPVSTIEEIPGLGEEKRRRDSGVLEIMSCQLAFEEAQKGRTNLYTAQARQGQSWMASGRKPRGGNLDSRRHTSSAPELPDKET